MNKIFLALIFIATPTFAQELNEFSNGSVADADAINENFQNLNDRIKTIEEAGGGGGGCSAEQDGSGVLITCADGTSAVLASEGTVIVYPESAVGEIPDTTELPSGDFYVRDASNTFVGLYISFDGGESSLRYYLKGDYSARFRAFSRMDLEEAYIESGGTLFYVTEDCSGTPFLPRRNSYLVQKTVDEWFIASGLVAPGTDGVNIVVKSIHTGVQHNRFGEPIFTEGTCGPVEYPRTDYAPAVRYIPDDSLMNLTFPLSIDQLP